MLRNGQRLGPLLGSPGPEDRFLSRLHYPMSYLLKRLKSTIRHMASMRGGLLAVACLAALGAFLSSDGLAQALAVASAVALGLLLLLMSVRLSEDHSQLRRLHKRQQELIDSLAAGDFRKQAKRRKSDTEAQAETRRLEHLRQVRGQILQARGEVASKPTLEATPSPPAAHLAAESGPTITVVVPCYNESRFVAETLESVQRQSFTEWECIVVDDASSDDSVSKITDYVRGDDRFKLVRHQVNGGLSAARNTGLRMAKGRYVTFLDADDLLMSNSLLDRLETLSGAGPDTVGSYCGMRIVPEIVTLDSLPAHEKRSSARFVDFVSARGECPFNAHAPLLITDIVRAAGGFDESMRDGAEDWDLWLRLMRRGFNFVPSRWQTAVYRQKHQSMAKTGARQHVLEARRLITASFESEDLAGIGRTASHPFPLALPHYERQLTLARRALQYAATSLARGERSAAEAILNGEDGRVEPWMDNHINFDGVITSGFRRAFGLSPGEVAEVSTELEPLRLDLLAMVAKASGQPQKPDLPQLEPPAVETLFLPQNAVHAQTMIAVAEQLPEDHSVAFLDIERVSGAQGAGPLLEGSAWPRFSMNEWALSHATHRNLVVSYPRDGAVEELVAATIAGGGLVFDVEIEGAAVMEIAAARRYAHDPTAIKAADLPNALVQAQSQAVIAANEPERPLLWFGASDPDPDSALAIEEYPHTIVDSDDLKRFEGIHKGDRCVIIGNGPSLNELDLTKLRDEYTIGVNGIFYAAEEMGFDLTYYVVEDTAVMRDNTEAIKAYSAGHKFFPSIYRSQVGEAPNVSYFMMNRGFYAETSPSYCIPRFSTDASQRVYSGQSVTIINLQLAYYMGFSEVALIGMDFSYTIPDDAKVEGALITSMSDDPNHFHPEYFGKGKVWKDPKLDRVLANYQLAKLIYEADGRRIVNATAGGKLELFDRVPYDELFG